MEFTNAAEDFLEAYNSGDHRKARDLLRSLPSITAAHLIAYLIAIGKTEDQMLIDLEDWSDFLDEYDEQDGQHEPSSGD